MTNAFVVLAAAATQPVNRPVWTELFNGWVFPLAIIMVVFYVMMFRSKRGQEKQMQDMLANLKKGDRVQTIGGIIGTVVETRDDEVLVKVDESANAKIRFVRKAIHKVLESDRTGGGKTAS